jgi:glutamyl-tRNA reductase
MSVFEATKRELRQLGDTVEQSAMAAAALELAYQMDEDNSLTSKSMANKELRETMRELREHAPRQSNDSIDDLDRARQKRRQRFG